MGFALVHGQPAAGGVHRIGVLHGHPVGLDHLGGHGLGGKLCQQAVQVQVQGRFLVHGAVEQVEFCVDGQNFGLQLGRFGCAFGGKGRRKAGLIRRHHRVGTAQHTPPARRLHGVDQLVFRHPFLPRKLVLNGKKVVGVSMAQCFQHRAAGQFQMVSRVFQVQPGHVIQHGLPHVAVPCIKDAADERISVIFVDEPHDGVHVKIGGAVGVAGEEQRLKAIGSCSSPDLISRAPLLGGVALGFHQPNSFPASSFAGMRAAMTSRIRPCS